MSDSSFHFHFFQNIQKIFKPLSVNDQSWREQHDSCVSCEGWSPLPRLDYCYCYHYTKVGLLCHAWREDVVPSLVDCIRFFSILFFSVLDLGSWFLSRLLSAFLLSMFVMVRGGGPTLSPIWTSTWWPPMIIWKESSGGRLRRSGGEGGDVDPPQLPHWPLLFWQVVLLLVFHSFFAYFYVGQFFTLFARYASCDVWHMSRDKRRYTLHIYVPSRYISSRLFNINLLQAERDGGRGGQGGGQFESLRSCSRCKPPYQWEGGEETESK